MPFAVKLQKNESITLSSTVLLNLTLTSITLDPSSKVSLMPRRKQSSSSDLRRIRVSSLSQF